ncbi:hypothetical protein N656DRAFT_277490 [Canariomyces notabilis]|uniref:Mucin-7 n=1 Tax=Canariomyces notabilis TaxID=2074819 RepID=A0AAN6TLV6_9PEZI|nr:hypothetical protein N656DRAFT_277490 [Canariomyces arenarius]
MSAVKNLRAMFEQKGETSPPDRGRSPGLPFVAGAESPRPLSKVRTSFIAVAKDGMIGLQREGSQDSLSATRKLSGDSNASAPNGEAENSNTPDKMSETPAKTNLKDQPIPESSRPDSGSKDAARPTEGTHMAKAGTSTASEAEAKRQVTSKSAVEELSSTNAGATQREAGATNGSSGGKDGEKVEKESSKSATRTTKPPPKPLAAATANKPAAKPGEPPATSKAPKSPAETSAPNPSVKKTPERRAQQSDKTITPRATPSAKATAASSAKKVPVVASPSGTGFVKPRPKSPTRPVKLPPSLTTHTAASGSKINAPRQSLSRASGNTQAAESHGRAPSRASVSTAGVVCKPLASKGLKRQNSTIGRPRPSLGPPPKQAAKDHPPTKREREVDEGFLARMMRPTQASASKVAEKVQTTSPRRAAVPATKKTAAVKPMKKTASNPTRTAPSSAQSHGSPAQQIAPTAEHATTANEIVEIAKASDGGVTLPSEANQQDASEEMAPVAEQSKTSEGVDDADGKGEGSTLSEPSEAAGKLAPSLMPKGPEPELALTPEPATNGHHEEIEGASPAKMEASSADAGAAVETADSQEVEVTN